jgi:hypothetical protein
LHGSQNLEIDEVEPKKANDEREFSEKNAIYATKDGIWVIYFAIIDRKRYKSLSLFNSCLDILISPEERIGPLYFFSITNSFLIQKPMCDGAIYILRREKFEQESAHEMFGAIIIFPHWISSKPAKPIAKLHIQPQDFPFLTDIHGHINEKLAQLIMDDPNGFPWPEALDD